MDRFTRQIMKSQIPFSDTVINGYGIKEIRKSAEFLHKVLLTAQYSVRDPKFKYINYTIMSPEKEFEAELVTYAGKPKSGSINGDVTMSSVRRVKYTFTYDGQPIWVDMYLPIVNSDNTMSISNTKYVLMPVLTDRIISPGRDHNFIKFYKHKVREEDVSLTLFKMGPDDKQFIVDRGLIPYFPKLYAIRTITDPKGFGAITPSALYILAKFSLSETNNRYGSDVKVIKEDKIKEYHDRGYTIFKGSGSQLPEMKMVVTDKNNTYVATKNTDSFSITLARSIMYMFEAIPSMGTMYEDTTMFWRYALGQMTFKMNISPEGLMPSINEHLLSLGTYVDSISREELRYMGYDDIDETFTFFDLVHLLLRDHHIFKEIGISNSSTVLDKSLDILYYVMYEIIFSFNTTFSKLNKTIQDKRNDGLSLSHQNVTDVMKSKFMRTKAIFSISKGTDSILPLILANNYCDNKILKITCLAELQSRGEGVKKKKSKGSNKIPADVEELKSEDFVYGNGLHLPKSLITPLARLNPYAIFNDHGELQIPDELNQLVEGMSKDLKNIAIKKDKDDQMSSLIQDTEIEDDSLGI